MNLKSPREIAGMAKSGAILAGVHQMLKPKLHDGMDTWEIEQLADDYITAHDAIASEKGVDGYLYATCISINDEVAHATPRKGLKIHNGDVVKIDMCVSWHGYQSDSAWTYVIGDKMTAAQDQLLKVTHAALYRGIEQAQVGNRVGDIGWAIQDYVENQHHMGDVRDLIGHGIGPSVHEDPEIYHYGNPHHGLRLKPGMVITIEPMVTLGTWELTTNYIPETGWEYYSTADGSLSAQYEHTLAITKNGPKILTSQDPIFDAKYLLSPDELNFTDL